MAPVVTERFYNIHYYEVDYLRRYLPTTLINYFQDIAILQSEQQGIGFDYLISNNYAWLLYQWDIVIHRYPLYNQNVKVTTCATSLKGINAYRAFNVFDENNQPMVAASSRWVLLDTQAMRICYIPRKIKQAYGVEDENARPLQLPKPGEPAAPAYYKEFDL